MKINNKELYSSVKDFVARSYNDALVISDEYVWHTMNQVTRQYDSIHYLADASNFKNKVMMSCELTRRYIMRACYELNGNSATGIKPGYVYAITNPAFPGYVKIGSTIDLDSRLRAYQTYSPKRDYSYLSHFFCEDRFAEERDMLNAFGAIDSEWCEAPESAVKKYIVNKRKDNSMSIPSTYYINSMIYMLENNSLPEGIAGAGIHETYLNIKHIIHNSLISNFVDPVQYSKYFSKKYEWKKERTCSGAFYKSNELGMLMKLQLVNSAQYVKILCKNIGQFKKGCYPEAFMKKSYDFFSMHRE